MTVYVRVFAHLKSVLGSGTLAVSLPEDASVADLLAHLHEAYPSLSRWRASVRVAVNGDYTAEDVALHDGDEVALIPPVSGG